MATYQHSVFTPVFTLHNSMTAAQEQPEASLPMPMRVAPLAPERRIFVVNPPKSKAAPELLPSGHTAGHINCPACEKRSLLRSEVALADMKFPDAFETWLAARLGGPERETSVRYITPNSEATYRDYAKALGKFFADLRLSEIHDGHLRTYQDLRAAREGNWKRTCGQNRIRKEIGLLMRVMKAARVWSEDLKGSYCQLPIQQSDLPRALDTEQQARLLHIMASRDEWLWIYYYTVLALNTCASTFELRMATIGDVNLQQRTFHVGPKASKNKFRNRTIPLESNAAMEAAEWLLRRARRFGAHAPEHYLFPFGVGNRHTPDPTKPMTKCAMKSQWQWIRRKAGLPNLRIYDLRHTAITNMAVAGIPISVIMSFAGHVTVKMSQHYTTVSMQTKRAAMHSAAEESAIAPEAPAAHPESSLALHGGEALMNW
jgi:integrase